MHKPKLKKKKNSKNSRTMHVKIKIREILYQQHFHNKF